MWNLYNSDGDLIKKSLSKDTLENLEKGIYQLEVSVVLDDGRILKTSHNIEILNTSAIEDTTPPIANAGKDITAYLGDTVTLDANTSSNGDNITYTWSLEPENNSFITTSVVKSRDKIYTYVAESTLPLVYTLTVKNTITDLNSTDIVKVTVLEKTNTLQKQLINKVYYWTENMISKYNSSNTYKHTYVLALYEDEICQWVELNLDIDKQNQDKKDRMTGNQIYTPDSALQVMSQCLWSNTTETLYLDISLGLDSATVEVPLTDGKLSIGDKVDPNCQVDTDCKISTINSVKTIYKDGIASHSIRTFSDDGHKATWYFENNNTLKIYYDGNVTVQFVGEWELTNNYINIIKNGNLVTRLNNQILKTGSKMGETINAYISDINTLSNETISLTNGLVAHYEFEGNANDSSGNGYNGIEKGIIDYQNGAIGKAINFNGNYQNYIRIAHSQDLNIKGNYSFSYWINRSSDSDSQFVFSKGRDCLNSYYSAYDGQLFNIAYGESWCDGEGIINNLPINEWNLVTVIIDNGNHKIKSYLNGQYKSEEIISAYSTTNEYDLVLGRHDTNNNGDSSWSYPYNGSFDDFRIYNRALSESEIQELYNLGQ